MGIRVWVYKVGKLKFGLSPDARLCSNKKSWSISGAAFLKMRLESMSLGNDLLNGLRSFYADELTVESSVEVGELVGILIP